MAHDVAEDDADSTPATWPRRSSRADRAAAFTRTRSFSKRHARWRGRLRKAGDDGTNDLLVSEVIRTNERHVWFVAEHLADTPVDPARARAGLSSARHGGVAAS